MNLLRALCNYGRAVYVVTKPSVHGIVCCCSIQASSPAICRIQGIKKGKGTCTSSARRSVSRNGDDSGCVYRNAPAKLIFIASASEISGEEERIRSGTEYAHKRIG